MKGTPPTPRDVLLEQTDLAVSFYDMAAGYLNETFEQIAKRVVPRGFGNTKTSAAFKREARKMFDLAR
jgi:hypothetical protein